MALDQFGEVYLNRIDEEGRTNLRSSIGAICSFISLVIVAMYGVQKALVLFNRKDVNMTVSNLPDYFDEQEMMG